MSTLRLKMEAAQAAATEAAANAVNARYEWQAAALAGQTEALDIAGRIRDSGLRIAAMR